jgi:hypothetical protein
MSSSAGKSPSWRLRKDHRLAEGFPVAVENEPVRDYPQEMP